MEPKINLSKRQHVILTEGRKEQTTFSHDSNEWIYTYHQHFMLAQKHGKGSEHPKGWYQAGYSSASITIRWLFTESRGGSYFAPELRFSAKDGNGVWKLTEKMGKAFQAMPSYGSECSPERLIQEMKATVVEYVENGWRTYKPIRVFGEDPLMTLARAAD